MTACTNNGGKARRVVTAALVGVLSVGAVPAIALATGTGSAGDVSLQAETPATLSGADIVYSKGQPGDVYYENGKQQGLVPSEIDPAVEGLDNIEVSQASATSAAGGYYYFYVKVGVGNTFETKIDTAGTVKYDNGKSMVQLKGTWQYAMPSTAGTYAVVVGQYNGAAGWDFVDVADTFTIAKKSLADATLIDGEDVTDTTFNWTGKSMSQTVQNVYDRMNVAVDGHILKKATDGTAATGDYTLYIYKQGAKDPMASTDMLDTKTSYVAVIDGLGDYAGHKEIPFTFGRLDLSTASITPVVSTNTPDASNIKNVVAAINDVVASDFGSAVAKDVVVTLESDPDGNVTGATDALGKYTFTIKAKDDSAWIQGETKVTAVKNTRDANIDFTACGTLDGSDYVVDLGAEKVVYFDLNRVKVTDGVGGPDVDYTFEIKDDEGKTYADDSALKNPGTYYVTVNAYEFKGADLVASSKTVKVVVSYANVTEADNIFFVYDGKNVESATSDEYDGTDLSEKMAFTVKVGDKVLTEGTDYDVTIERAEADGGWTKVDEVVDAGDYLITVSGKTFSGSATFDFTVNPMKLDAKAAVNGGVATDKTTYLAYTGDVLTPTFSFYKDGAEVEVPADAFEVTYDAIGTDSNGLPDASDVKDTDVALKAKGAYGASFSATAAGSNYDFDGVTVTFLVSDKKVFLDVPANEWYSQAVYTARDNGYMNGDGSGKTFSPMRELTRAEAACVLFNMAGGDAFYKNETIDGYDPDGKVFETGFSDVTGNEFYAKAIAWAEQTGVINGYADGTFGVSRKVTNEEFACMLANYAKAKGEYKAVDADETLAAYPDASVVSDWAKDSVAWCVSEGIMGGGANISPAGSILRMRAATMAVNAQPEKAGSALIPIV
ncbi:S-layer homology domain-containing protein [Olsenella sp. An293]|uniref:S-layer homology domain-containing protein n=1 Tax=Olsenella sp. An293 TaxID=1965626 RepID=UPI000B3A535C|nr:S-layer homology domain-containing protein [Olsenella sp. An293]OUO30922.1 hypothetical protein B5F85_10400 [Olsenella sp. An293]